MALMDRVQSPFLGNAALHELPPPPPPSTGATAISFCPHELSSGAPWPPIMPQKACRGPTMRPPRRWRTPALLACRIPACAKALLPGATGRDSDRGDPPTPGSPALRQADAA